MIYQLPALAEQSWDTFFTNGDIVYLFGPLKVRTFSIELPL